MKSGQFSLQLVHAETKEPLKEFTGPDGKVYVEASPDLEYFIRCSSDRGVIFGTDTTVNVEVDDKCLGYDQPFKTSSGDLGLWKCQNGVNTFLALMLTFKKRDRGALSSSVDTMPPVGRVQATFYETQYLNEMEEKDDCDKTNDLNEAFDSAAPVPYEKKKAFASIAGSVVVGCGTPSKWIRRRARGRFLGELTLHYTSAHGLSQLGILPRIAPVATTPTNCCSCCGCGRGSASSEPRRKRARTQPHVVSPTKQSDSVIDLTGDD